MSKKVLSYLLVMSIFSVAVCMDKRQEEEVPKGFTLDELRKASVINDTLRNCSLLRDKKRSTALFNDREFSEWETCTLVKSPFSDDGREVCVGCLGRKSKLAFSPCGDGRCRVFFRMYSCKAWDMVTLFSRVKAKTSRAKFWLCSFCSPFVYPGSSGHKGVSGGEYNMMVFIECTNFGLLPVVNYSDRVDTISEQRDILHYSTWESEVKEFAEEFFPEYESIEKERHAILGEPEGISFSSIGRGLLCLLTCGCYRRDKEDEDKEL